MKKEKTAEKKIYAQNFLDEELANDDLEALHGVVYNNPIGGIFRIESQISIASVSVYSLLGQEIFSANYKDQLALSIESTAWSSGLYLVQLKLENGQEVAFKVLK